MKKIYQKLKSNVGFSLVEMILYLIIVAILLVAVIGFHFSLGDTATKLTVNIDVSNSRRTAMNIVDYLIRNSDGLFRDVYTGCSNFTSDPPALALYFNDDTYLPGTCVDTGGAVRVTVSSTLKQLVMDCYPNIDYNGRYKACDTDSYPIGNTYYLTAPSLQVFDDGLEFATSTATTTNDTFTTILTHLTLGNISGDEAGLYATSTATSTVLMRNEQPNGLIAWWRMDDVDPNFVIDSAGNHDGTCNRPDIQGGLVGSGGSAYDFEADDSEFCNIPDTDDLNFSNGFTIAAWVNMESFPSSLIVNKADVANAKGYSFGFNSNNVYCEVGNGTDRDRVLYEEALSDGATYHMACVYNPNNPLEIIRIYVYKEGSGPTGEFINTDAYILVNNQDDLGFGSNDGLESLIDGVVDELRMYNRPLSEDEIYALQTETYEAE